MLHGDMSYIPEKLDPSDGLTKLLGWVLHNQHASRLMGYFTCINFLTEEDNLQSKDSTSREGVAGTDAHTDSNPNPNICHLSSVIYHL